MSEYEHYIKSDFTSYAGEWIAILAKKVVAHGATFKEVAEIVDKEFAGKKALITRVPPKVTQLSIPITS